MKEMNRKLIGAALLAVACLTLLGARPQGQQDGLFAGLEVGQAVGVKDLGSVYEITVLGDDLPAGFVVTEVGEGHLGVRDHAGVVERRIPITSIKSVAWMRVGGRRRPRAGTTASWTCPPRWSTRSTPWATYTASGGNWSGWSGGWRASTTGPAVPWSSWATSWTGG